MKETTLRNMIRKQIKESLKEAPSARAQVGTKLGSIEKMAGVKMLKKALGQGSPVQQAAGLLQVVQAISGNNDLVAKQLSRMLQKKDSLSGDAGKPAGAADKFESVNEADEFEMSKVKGGLAKSKLGTQIEIDRAGEVLKNIKGLKDTDRAKALAYILSNAGFDRVSLQKLLNQTKTQLNKYKK